MKTYTERPQPRRARQVWDHFTQRRGKPPQSMWKNPNCWMTPQVVGNAWGWWVAQYGFNDYEYVAPSELPRKTGADNE